MFRFTLWKMFKNKWLAFSLFIGYLIGIAIVSSMPIYNHAILSRMLQKDLQQIQTKSGMTPGLLQTEATLHAGTSPNTVKTERFLYADNFLRQDILPRIGLGIKQEILLTTAKGLRIVYPKTPEDRIAKDAKKGEITACTGLFENVAVLEGRLPAKEPRDGVYEAIISETAAMETGCSYGSVYDVYESRYTGAKNVHAKKFTVEIVGVFTIADPNLPYFRTMHPSNFNQAILLDSDLFSRDFVNNDDPLFNYASWIFEVDYSQITPENCGDIAVTLENIVKEQVFPYRLRAPFESILKTYDLRQQQLTSMLWVIEIPILLMLLFYIVMVSRLILGHERNEIAVLHSRGSSKGQMLQVYLYQAILLACAALASGPFLSLVFCQLIGSSNGFLEFVGRKALQVSLTDVAIQYAILTAVALIITMILVVVMSRDTSIVSFKRKKSARKSIQLWEKLGLDVICLGVSIYGLYNYQNRLEVIKTTGASAAEVPIDFMMYGSSTLFVLGVTLLFLRLFPYLIKLIFWAGRRLWSPVLYLSLINISRAKGTNQMISLFLIFTLSMGVFNAVTVRTLNQNEEDRIRYAIGADVVIQEEWPSTGGSSGDPLGGSENSDEPIYYTEPRFAKYEAMNTAESVARVLTVDRIQMSVNSKSVNKLTLMGVVPDEFGKTCWFRDGLLPYHLNEYLNLLASEPKALLLSTRLMEENEIKPGDTVYLTVGANKDMVQFVAYAGIEYFPAFNPLGSKDKPPLLAVGNLIYLQQEMKLQPYAIWLKKAPGVTSAAMYQELSDMKINLTQVKDASVKVTEMKNDPMTQGINGFFTLSFLITMLITLVGFFIYWILTIKGRLLQFGILRSMGLSRFRVVFVLLWEQILVSVTAIVAGLGFGTLTSLLFAPILECNVNPADQMLPFLVTASPKDYLLIILLVTAMLVLAGIVLARIIYKLRASEILKLGED